MKHPTVFVAVTEGSVVGTCPPTRVHYFATSRRARRWARQYLAVHTHAAVRMFRRQRSTP